MNLHAAIPTVMNFHHVLLGGMMDWTWWQAVVVMLLGAILGTLEAVA